MGENAGDGAGDEAASAWARDDWEPESRPAPTFATRAAEVGSSPAPGGPRGRQEPAGDAPAWITGGSVPGDDAEVSGPRRVSARLLAGCGVVAISVVAVAVFALTRTTPDGDASAASVPDAATRESGSDSTTASSSPRSTAPRGTVSRMTVPDTIAIVVSAIDADPDDSVPAPAQSFVVREPEIAEIELGAVPQWTEWTMPVAEPLVSSAPTEVVFVAGRTLHRLDVPSGSIRSLGLDDLMPFEGEVAVLPDAIALSTGTSVHVVRDGVPVVRHDVGGVVTAIRARPASGDFIASIDFGDDGGERFVLFDPDGTVVRLTHPRLAQTWIGMMAIGPTGELIFSDVGGTYRFDPATGLARRADEGVMLAAGRNHALLQRCDETLECSTVLVDFATWTGVAVPPVLDQLSEFGYDIPRLSPTGTHLAVGTYGPSAPELQIYDLGSGSRVDGAGGLDRYLWHPIGEAWASDGSGVFVVDGSGSPVFESIDGRRVEMFGFGRIGQLAVQPAVAGS